jgi:hypothetical protein
MGKGWAVAVTLPSFSSDQGFDEWMRLQEPPVEKETEQATRATAALRVHLRS